MIDEELEEDELSDFESEESKSISMNNNIQKTKTRTFIEGTRTLKCKLNSICDNDIIKQLIINRVHKSNKIIFEGSQLFYIYILYIIENNIQIKITSNTIRRCMRHLIIDSCNSRVRGKTEEDKLIKIKEDQIIKKVKNTYFNFNTIGRENDFINEDELMKPIEATCDIYFTNLKLHISRNFKKYQRRYLFYKLSKLINKTTNELIGKSNVKFIVYAVQQKINGNLDYSYRTDIRKNKYDKIVNEFDIIKFINNENILIKNNIKLPIGSSEELVNISEDNIYDYLKYFHMMLKELSENKEKKFNLIPHFSPKMRYVRLEARPLSKIYNDWKKEINSDKNNIKINVKDFEKDFRNYLDEMFTVKRKFKKILKKYPTVRSICTNGYDVSIGFEKTKTIHYIPKKKEEDDKKIIPEKKEKKIKELIDFEEKYTKNGLFDATEIKSNNEFLNKFDIGGVDPGNSIMLDISMENGLHTTVHKNYYQDLSHITRNKEILERKIEENKMNEIYSEMSLDNTKTINIKEFMKYVEKVRKHWKKIWEFSENKKILSLKFDTFVHKEYAISRIAKEIVNKIKNEETVSERHKKYFNKGKFTENKDKPIILAIGTGNGNITINNTKHSQPKGPIKKLVNELSKQCVVILTCEHNTSQMCNECNNFLTNVDEYKFPKMKNKHKMDKSKEEQDIQQSDEINDKIINNKIGITKRNREIIHECKKIKYFNEKIHEKDNKIEKSINNNKLDKTIEKLENQVADIGYYGPSYRIRCCANKHEKTKRCILWERNMNASKNMIKMMRNILINQTKGEFLNKKTSGYGNSRDKHIPLKSLIRGTPRL